MSTLDNALRTFLVTAGLPRDCGVVRLGGGANNQVYRVEADDSWYLLKVYFQHPDDKRDRLGAEFSFCTFAWDHGVDACPKPLASDAAVNAGLYEFIEGGALTAQAITQERIDQAVKFFRDINVHRNDAAAARLPLASEACFSIEEHLDCVDRRVKRLARVADSTDVERNASEFVQNRLSPAWDGIRDAIMLGARGAALELGEALQMECRCVSPSDFGFHNAILAADGRLRFFDFEYAGWDDPAKTICDFFCQPKLEVDSQFYTSFGEGIASSLSGSSEATIARANLLLPAYQIKWCCIMLNDFLPVDGCRRSFAGAADELESRRAKQLNKACAELDMLNA